MASAYFRKFAIENGLTVDYGYMYGKYKDFFISLKETLGSTKMLYILTDLGSKPEELKQVLSVFNEEELPEYCITDMKRDARYIQFTFELVGDRVSLIVRFLDKFIESYLNLHNGEKPIIECPICKKPILDNEETSIVDIAGILSPMHVSCYENKKEEKKKELVMKEKQETGSKTRYHGIAGAILFGFIYFALLIVSFFFTQFILKNAESGDTFIMIIQYLPSLVAFAGAPLISLGYDKFKGAKGATKYVVVLWITIIMTLLGTFFGFVASLLLITNDISFVELIKLVGRLISCKDVKGSTSFRWGFYLYIIISLVFAIISIAVKFSGKKEIEDSESTTFEKLD